MCMARSPQFGSFGRDDHWRVEIGFWPIGQLYTDEAGKIAGRGRAAAAEASSALGPRIVTVTYFRPAGGCLNMVGQRTGRGLT